MIHITSGIAIDETGDRGELHPRFRRRRPERQQGGDRRPAALQRPNSPSLPDAVRQRLNGWPAGA